MRLPRTHAHARTLSLTRMRAKYAASERSRAERASFASVASEASERSELRERAEHFARFESPPSSCPCFPATHNTQQTRAHAHAHTQSQHTTHNTHERQPASQEPPSQPACLSLLAQPGPCRPSSGAGGDCLRVEPKGSKIIKKPCTRRKNPNHEILRRGARSKCVRKGENS